MGKPKANNLIPRPCAKPPPCTTKEQGWYLMCGEPNRVSYWMGLSHKGGVGFSTEGGGVNRAPKNWGGGLGKGLN